MTAATIELDETVMDEVTFTRNAQNILCDLDYDKIPLTVAELVPFLKNQSPDDIEWLIHLVMTLAHGRPRKIELLALFLQSLTNACAVASALQTAIINCSFDSAYEHMKSTWKLLFHLVELNVLEKEAIVNRIKDKLSLHPSDSLLCNCYIWLGGFVTQINPDLVKQLANGARAHANRLKRQECETRHLQHLIESMDSYTKDQWKSHHELLRDLYPKESIGYALYHDNVEMLQRVIGGKKGKEEKPLELSYLDPSSTPFLEKKTPLEIAARYGAVSCLDFLITSSQKIKLSAALENWRNLFWESCIGGNSALVRTVYDLGEPLRENQDEDLNFSREVNICAATFNLDLFEWIVGTVKYNIIESETEAGKSLLATAVKANYLDLVIWAIQHGANINRRSGRNSQSPLFYAIKFNNSIAVKIFLSSKNLELSPEDKDCIIQFAAMYSQPTILKILLADHRFSAATATPEKFVCFVYI